AQPILLLGLRTAGSYFAPLLRAFFKAQGYRSVALMTIEPNKGIGRQESKELKQFATRGYWAVILDDAPTTSTTILAGYNIAHQAGFAPSNVKFLVPTHPAIRNWFKTIPADNVITLPPEQWHKSQLLDPKVAELRLAEYFRNFAGISVVASRRADE